jgi:hypothetical protein
VVQKLPAGQLYVRALAPEIEDTLFVVRGSGTTYEINLSTSDNPDQTVVISSFPRSLQAQAERAGKVPALDLMRSMMRGLPVDGYEVIEANQREVYRDAFFSMKLVEVYWCLSSILAYERRTIHGQAAKKL